MNFDNFNWEKSSYYNNNGKYQDLISEIEKLVPIDGACNTIEGEFFRAICAINYDYFNNGFCNNWSGPFNFLQEYNDVLGLNGCLNILGDYRFGLHRLTESSPNIAGSINYAIDKIIEYISMKEGNYEKFDGDMFGWEE